MALPQTSPRTVQRRRADRVLRGGDLPGLFHHSGSGADRGAAGFHPGAEPPFLRRRPFALVPAIVGKRNPTTLRMEWKADVTKVPIRFPPPPPPCTNGHLVGARRFERSTSSFLGSDRLGRDQWSRIMHGTQTSMTVGLVAVALERHPGRRAGRHLGLCRRQDRPGDPAPDRAAAIGADHPDLAGAVGRACRATGRRCRCSSPSP